MDEKLYWIWLSLVFPCGSDKPNRILSICRSASDFFQLPEEEKRAMGLFNQQELLNLRGTSLKRAEKVLRDCEQSGIRTICWDDAEYPKRLKLIYGPPVVLYAVGNLLHLEKDLVIAVVGTRHPSDYSVEMTKLIAGDIAASGAVIVSGCAVGIDGASHLGALQAGGRTIGVLGCGLDIDYPFENHALKKQILEQGGALFSELPPGTQPYPKIFPVRNRMIAGVSNGVLVTQAPIRSGALITAELAIEQGKEVFCVPPYDLRDPECFGVVRYLRDGAVPVYGAADVLEPYAGAYAHRLNAAGMPQDYVERMKLEGKQEKIRKSFPVKAASNVGTAPANITPEKNTQGQAKHSGGVESEESRQNILKIVQGLDETHLKVYNTLDTTPKPLDDLATESALRVSELLAILTELEILGLAASHGGRRYSLTVLR